MKDQLKRKPYMTTETQTRSLRSGSDVKVIAFRKLRETGLVDHFFTTREGGVSEGIYRSMNLSFTLGDDETRVKENFRRIAEVLGAGPEDIVCTDQTHTTNVRVATAEDAGKGITRERDYADVDGLITNVPGLVLAAFASDCVPVFIVDPGKRAIGLVHSGWKGTVGRIAGAAIALMTEKYGTDPADLICAVGPSICADCYEVSEDVAERFCGVFSRAEGDILSKNGKTDEKGAPKYQLDLWRANVRVLTDAGVRPENIAVTDVCTCCNDSLLFSHRATKGRRGNNGAFLVLK